MTTLVIIAPEGWPVSLDEARKHVRGPEDGTDDTDILQALRAAVEAVEISTNRKLRPFTLELHADDWPASETQPIELTFAPVRTVNEVRYLDVDGVEQELPADQYSWKRTSSGGEVYLVASLNPPALFDRPGSVRIEFEAGYDQPGNSGSGDDADLALPFIAKSAVLLKLQLLYERDGLDDHQASLIERSYKALVNAIKVYA